MPMTPQIERRQADRRASDEDLSPEYLALLDVCGGEIRAADRAALSSRRHALAGEGGSGPVAQPEVAPDAAPVHDRRSSTR